MRNKSLWLSRLNIFRLPIALVCLVSMWFYMIGVNHVGSEALYTPPKYDTIADLRPKVSTEKAAVIMEIQMLDNLIPIIVHFFSVLGPDWPIHLWTSKDNFDQLKTSRSLRREFEAGRFHIREFPSETFSLATHDEVSSFFTKPWIWEAMSPYKHLFFFQPDSIICSRSGSSVDDFLKYDFIGAPIDESRGIGMGWNGGLSIRNRTMCLDIVREHDCKWNLPRAKYPSRPIYELRYSFRSLLPSETISYCSGDSSIFSKPSRIGKLTFPRDVAGETEKTEPNDSEYVQSEDQWFSKHMREMPLAELPDLETAKSFAVETIWAERPLGYYQTERWHQDKIEEVMKWCPEHSLASQFSKLV